MTLGVWVNPGRRNVAAQVAGCVRKITCYSPPENGLYYLPKKSTAEEVEVSNVAGDTMKKKCLTLLETL